MAEQAGDIREHDEQQQRLQDDLVRRFLSEQSRLEQAVAGLSEQQATEVWCGHWGVREIVAHLAGWEYAITEALERMARGERAVSGDINLSDVEGTNDTFARRAAGKSFRDVLADYLQAAAHFERAVRTMPMERLMEGKTGRRLVEIAIGHPEEHIKEIDAWRKQ